MVVAGVVPLFISRDLDVEAAGGGSIIHG